MRRSIHTTLLVSVGLALIVAGTIESRAGARTFFSPMVGGERLHACLQADEECGKPAADAWCRSKGYESALLYQTDRREGIEYTRSVLDGRIYTGGESKSFVEVKCWSPQQVAQPASLSVPAVAPLPILNSFPISW